MISVVFALVLTAGAVASEPPIVVVTADDTPITASCIVRIPPGTVIADANGDGVLHIAAPNITVEFEPGSVLRGAAADTPWDRLSGLGIRIADASGVTIRNARVSGFKVGLHAERADGLVIDAGDYSDNFRQRLASTPRAEVLDDWLWPHENDQREWTTRYGAAVSVASSAGVTIRGVVVRRGQNGIVLDRVTTSKIYDNDCSFLSGWGLAMWRSSRNVVSRNAFDFCVRGYSHGVYNRGQDSAGILAFEQCTENIFAFNSATHSGDGFFGFAGKEALGEKPASDPAFDHTGKGSNRNLLFGNDFSYAPAHGIEMTFSFGNVFAANRLVENAITGIWGGYSQDTLIVANTIERNGTRGVRLERGGVNIEHGIRNRIARNAFSGNAAGVHLWSDEDVSIMKTPWAKANHRGSRENIIDRNTFSGDQLALHLRESPATTWFGNTLADVAKDIDATPGSEPLSEEVADVVPPDPPEVPGTASPVGAREMLRGRDKIIMDQWGPWDHQSPMARLAERTSGAAAYEVFGVTGTVAAEVLPADGGVVASVEPSAEGGPTRVRLTAPVGISPYVLRITAPGFERRFEGSLVSTVWSVRCFPWTVDPRENIEGWRAEAAAPAAIAAEVQGLNLRFGSGGPPGVGVPAFKDSTLPNDRFGTIARTTIPLNTGTWRITTLSDDGVRVLVDGVPVIENWTWHAPTRDTGTFRLDARKDVEIVVEHFELEGFAVLAVDIEPAPDTPPPADPASTPAGGRP